MFFTGVLRFKHPSVRLSVCPVLMAMAVLVLTNGDLFNDEPLKQFLPDFASLIVEGWEVLLHQATHRIAQELEGESC